MKRGGGKVRLTLSWSEPNQHLFDITIELTATGRETFLSLPAWRPGRYLIQNYAANIREWAATSGRRSLAVQKVDKSRWRIQTQRGKRIIFRYRYFAGTLDAGSSYLDESEAYFNGSNLFMMVEGQREARYELKLQVPRGWRVATQLERVAAGEYVARDYDYLIDSPTIVSPDLSSRSFALRGKRVALTFQRPGELELDSLVAPVKRICAEQAALFDEFPSPRYEFLYHLGSIWHGVEHENSSSIILKRRELLGSKEGDSGFDHFLSITSHEFFHLWNVKRLLPERFAPYDYSRETPTRLLWVMEGLTSYFGDLTICRSGVWSAERYLQHLAEEITLLQNSPGRTFLSLAQSSFDAWLQEPAQMHDKANAWISFYNKGEIVGALVDLVLLDATNGKRGLDDVMRLLWRQGGRRSRGMEEDAFERAVLRVGGAALEPFLQAAVHGQGELPYARLFALAGVSFESRSDEKESGSGIDVATREGLLVVSRVLQGSPGATAGVMAGDEVIAVGEERVSGADQFRREIMRARGRTVQLITARDGRLIERSITPDMSQKVSIELTFAAEGSERQRRIRQRWLGGRVE